MYKHIFYPVILLFTISFQVIAQTEEFYTKEKLIGTYKSISFSGFRVELVPSDTFYITFSNENILKKQSIQEDKLSLMIVDQTGQVPKDTIQVYINGYTDFISIHNGELVMEEHLITDSLKVNFTTTSGILKVHTNKLYVTAGGGIDCEVEGTTSYFYGHQGGMSKIHHENLISDTKEIKETRYF